MNISPASISLMQSQLLNSLVNSASGDKKYDSWTSVFSLMVSNGTQFNQLSSDALSLFTQSDNAKSLLAAGRNMALNDPESAYRMMTVINNNDVSYKAQFSELNQMKSYISKMQDAGQNLGSIDLSTGNDSIKSQLQDFVSQYNNWIQRFDPDMQKGGLLSDTQAAQVSQYELEQNIKNRFYGIKDGLHGLSDTGITIDPNTKLASLDIAKLDSVLATNKQGVVDTVQEFSANFTKSASLLNSDGNFILSQLDNLNRAIHYIADNKDSLQKEFGIGDTAKPTGQIAQALVAYQQIYGI